MELKGSNERLGRTSIRVKTVEDTWVIIPIANISWITQTGNNKETYMIVVSHNNQTQEFIILESELKNVIDWISQSNNMQY